MPARLTIDRQALARDDVRHGVRALLTAADRYNGLDQATRREIASSLVRIASAALAFADSAGANPPSSWPRRVSDRQLASTLAEDSGFSSAAVDRIAPTTETILKAVSFPRFVGELITGVFKAMNDSNQQQLDAYVGLIRNVAATTESFEAANYGDAGARAWLAEQFAGSFVVQGDEDDGFDDPGEMDEAERAELQAEREENTRLMLRPGAQMPSPEAIRMALGLKPGDSVPSGSPESLVGPARAAMARNRQQMLATMVMMGMQRIVIDGGRLNAAMRFHIDASSAASEDRGSRFDARHTSSGKVKAQFGPWGAEVQMQNTIGYVSTEKTMTDQELNADLELDSSVELVFRSDYVPLEFLAGGRDVSQIRANSLNPQAQPNSGATERTARDQGRQAARTARAGHLETGLKTPPVPTIEHGEITLDSPTGEEEQNTTEGSQGATADAAQGDSANQAANEQQAGNGDQQAGSGEQEAAAGAREN